MKFTQIRNATLHIEYAGKRFLIDPMLGDKGSFPGFAGTENSHLANPLVDLPMNLTDILNVDAIIVTHLHPDHWDAAAEQHIDKQQLIFVQDQKDADLLHHKGFKNLQILGRHTNYHGILLTKTAGQHGSDEIIAVLKERLGNVSGVIFRHPEEKTVYIAGDTVWNSDVANSLHTYHPDIVILNCGEARIVGLGPIIMGIDDLWQVHQAAPEAILIASHMEAVNHAVLSRKTLRRFIQDKGLTEQIKVPDDGQSYQFSMIS